VHYYNAAHSKLIDLGLHPHLLNRYLAQFSHACGLCQSPTYPQ
jgi:hypothetical protein